MELERNSAAFAVRGIGVCAISYDSVEILAHFARRAGITIPLLADIGSKAISAFRILRSTWTGEEDGGLPNPVTYYVDQNGVVLEKYFEENYRERQNLDSLLVTRFGAAPSTEGAQFASQHLRMKIGSSIPMVRPGNVFSLVMDLELAPGFHVYAPEVKGGYVPVTVSLAEDGAFRLKSIHWPPSHQYSFPALNETLPVYADLVRVTLDVGFGSIKDLKEKGMDTQQADILGFLRYQACSEMECFPPTKLQFRLSLPIAEHDWNRVPEDLRNKK